MIAPKEYAEKLGAKYQTVMLWLRQGLIPNAEKHPLPTGGHYYLIPADAPKPETQRGPKPKAGATEAKKATNGAAESKPAKKRAAKKGKSQ